MKLGLLPFSLQVFVSFAVLMGAIRIGFILFFSGLLSQVTTLEYINKLITCLTSPKQIHTSRNPSRPTPLIYHKPPSNAIDSPYPSPKNPGRSRDQRWTIDLSHHHAQSATNHLADCIPLRGVPFLDGFLASLCECRADLEKAF